MSKQASKRLIGVFVLGAVFLVVASIVVFGSGTLFTKSHKNVLFFAGSVKGLQIGAPVVFRGVQIGHVTNIVVEFNEKELMPFVPVYIEVDERRIVPLGDKQSYDQQFLQSLINKGLKAQLQMQSFVTGQLMVNLDFYPNTPVKLVGLEKRYPEIPTVPSSLEQLTKKLEELPLDEIANRLNETLAGINRLVNSRDLQASIGSLNQLLKNTDALVKNLDSEIKPLASDIRGTTAAARAAFAQAEKTLRFDEGAPGEIALSIKETLSAASATMKETQTAVANLNKIAVQNANLGYDISRTLEQTAELARSIRILADYLERHPESLLRGKSTDKGE